MFTTAVIAAKEAGSMRNSLHKKNAVVTAIPVLIVRAPMNI